MFTGNGGVSIWVKISRVGRSKASKQAKKQIYWKWNLSFIISDQQFLDILQGNSISFSPFKIKKQKEKVILIEKEIADIEQSLTQDKEINFSKKQNKKVKRRYQTYSLRPVMAVTSFWKIQSAFVWIIHTCTLYFEFHIYAIS